ncbi:MAG: glycosyltransferase involved in cell wall biosynthesis [Planctomycetota bacterium]|jgi:glycosyltransferase involved in cell wall biosynthesis
MLSFIVPAHDEEASIVATVESIVRSAHGHAFEVIVVDDASTDRTAELAAAAGARVVSVELRQIGGARNAGAEVANGDLFVFVDGDTRITKQVVEGVVAATNQGAIGGGAMVRFDRPMPIYAHLMMPLMTRLYFMMKLAAGCFVFATRDAFEAIGGFDLELFAGEEIELSRALKRYAKTIKQWRGHRARFVVVRAPVETSSRKLRTFSGFRMLGELLRLLALGRRGVRKRENLSLWYGPRRPDPGSCQVGDAPSGPQDRSR